MQFLIYLKDYYCRKRSCGKVMFSVVPVCPQEKGSHVTITHATLDFMYRLPNPGTDILKPSVSASGSMHPTSVLSCLRIQFWGLFTLRKSKKISKTSKKGSKSKLQTPKKNSAFASESEIFLITA